MKPKATRSYSVIVIGPGCHFETWPPMQWRSNQRIRAFAHTFFVKWFGRQPDDRDYTWHVDGFMAECCDRRGFTVQVEQWNHGDPRHTDGTWNRPAAPAPQLLLTWPTDERKAS